MQSAGQSPQITAPFGELIGMLAISAAMAGCFVRPAGAVERALLGVAGVALVYPSFAVSLPGLALLLVIAGRQQLRARRSSGP